MRRYRLAVCLAVPPEPQSLCFGRIVRANGTDENILSASFTDEMTSSMRRAELGELAAFVAVADELSFRTAAARMGVTPSALSHTIRQVEERHGVRLLNRTTRKVSLTDAGERLLSRLRPALDEIGGAVQDLDRDRQRPYGRLAIVSGHTAASAEVSGSDASRSRITRRAKACRGMMRGALSVLPCRR